MCGKFGKYQLYGLLVRGHRHRAHCSRWYALHRNWISHFSDQWFTICIAFKLFAHNETLASVFRLEKISYKWNSGYNSGKTCGSKVYADKLVHWKDVPFVYFGTLIHFGFEVSWSALFVVHTTSFYLPWNIWMNAQKVFTSRSPRTM